jgi:RES domain-containing protein
LEVRVHLDLPLDLVPDDYVLLTIDLGEASVELVRSVPADPSNFGDTWLQERRTSVLQVPSAIVAESSNLLLNPLHSNAKGFRMVERRPFSFDRRLWSSS